MDLRDELDKLPNKVLYLNLLITQAFLVIVGFILYFFFLRKEITLAELYHVDSIVFPLLFGIGFACFVVGLDLLLMKVLPEGYFDDGGINERLFRDVNIWQIAVIAFLVSMVEEFVFRGILQNMIGILWSSLVFAALHYRYLNNWVYGSLVIGISLGFGLMYEWTGSLWSTIFAHFLIDFTLGVIIRYRLVSFVK